MIFLILSRCLLSNDPMFLPVDYTSLPSNNHKKSNCMYSSSGIWGPFFVSYEFVTKWVGSTTSGPYTQPGVYHFFVKNSNSCSPWFYDSYHKTTLVIRGSCIDLRMFQSCMADNFLFWQAKTDQILAFFKGASIPSIDLD